MYWTVLGTIFLVAGIVALVRFVRASKDTFELVVENPTVVAGEPLKCRVVMESKRMIQCNQLTLTLIGTKELREARAEGSVLTPKEVHRSEHVLCGIKTFRPKQHAEFKFDLPTPAPKHTGALDAGNDLYSDDLRAAVMAGSGRNLTSWRVELVLDAKGKKKKKDLPVTVSNSDVAS